MGHIGPNPIRAAWYCVVLPALVLNYAGQIGNFLDAPDLAANPFFKLAPNWSIYPLVALATLATIIASQAIITGAFSMTRQAMQLGYFPGVRINQTSAEEHGQIYVPFVNWTMMAFTVGLTAGFGSSDRLAGAYGTAVSITMVLTTALLYHVMRHQWRWSLCQAATITSALLAIDLAFFSANLLKILDGGWIPLTFGVLVFTIMTTWHYGVEATHRRNAAISRQPARFFEHLRIANVARVRGTAVFLTRVCEAIPPIIVNYVKRVGSLQKTVICLTVSFEDVPRIRSKDRVRIEQLDDGFWRVIVHFGFVEVPNLPAALALASALSELPVDVHVVPVGSLDLMAVSRITQFGNMVTMRIFQSPLTPFNRAIKRAFDVAAAVVGLIVASPLFVIVPLAIKLDSRGPVLFRQTRHGFNNEPIRVLKFRSMTVMEDGDSFRPVIRHDPRVTRLGRFMRHTNIDELPQLFNVLVGDMSLVGPRPHATAQNEVFAELISSFFRRHNVKPGITGWAQVNGRNALSWEERFRMDTWYVEHWSVGLDARIIWKTMRSVLKQKDISQHGHATMPEFMGNDQLES